MDSVEVETFRSRVIRSTSSRRSDGLRGRTFMTMSLRLTVQWTDTFSIAAASGPLSIFGFRIDSLCQVFGEPFFNCERTLEAS